MSARRWPMKLITHPGACNKTYEWPQLMQGKALIVRNHGGALYRLKVSEQLLCARHHATLLLSRSWWSRRARAKNLTHASRCGLGNSN